MKLFHTFLFFFGLILAGSFIQKQILIPHYSLQHQPTETDIKSAQYDNTNEKGVFHGQTVYSYLTPDRLSQDILGLSNGPKRIEVDLTNQRLYAFEGDRKIYDFVVSTGLYDWTPRGTFYIWIKLRYSKMEGGSKAFGTYYYLPNVPHIMYFANEQIPAWRGFGIHGAYWHNDFGRPKSHGCINLTLPDAEKLYYWAEPNLNGQSSIRASADNPGTPIIIYGKYGS